MRYKWMSVINIRLQVAAGMRLYLMDCHVVLRLPVSALRVCGCVCESQDAVADRTKHN